MSVFGGNTAQIDEYLFAFAFVAISWVASVQGARLVPHGIKKV